MVAITLVGGLAAGCSVFGIRTAAEPNYSTRLAEGDREIREYDSYVVAVVSVEGEYKQSGNNAFRLLFDYISGKNATGQPISMTAPVLQESAGTKIDMTAPVLQHREGNAWQTAFVLPAEYTLESAPRPLDERISLAEVPARKVAVLRYSGLVDNEEIAARAEQLIAWLEDKPYLISSAPRSARYDPPFALPFLRRNEVHITLTERDDPSEQNQ